MLNSTRSLDESKEDEMCLKNGVVQEHTQERKRYVCAKTPHARSVTWMDLIRQCVKCKAWRYAGCRPQEVILMTLQNGHETAFLQDVARQTPPPVMTISHNGINYNYKLVEK
jgi:hypothetical protein